MSNFKPEDSLYHYRAIVTSVYDGDTCTCDIDAGLDIWKKGEKIRLSGINAPEIRGAEKIKGKETRDILRDWIVGKEILLQTILDKKGKYGRYLGVIWQNGENINEKLVKEGLAVKKEYK